MKKILVPTDFSEPAMAALGVAITVAKKSRAELILLHVVDHPTSDSFNVEGEVSHDDNWENKIFTLKLIEKSKQKLAELAARTAVEGVAVKQELRLGNPFHGIHTMIADHEVDLVIMGTKGHSKLEKMITGSNTEKTIRYSHCPVLTIHRNQTVQGFKNIVYATSMMERDDQFSKTVVGFQELFDSTLHIVWINTPAFFQSDTAARKALEIFANRLHLKNYTLNTFSEYTQEDGILYFAATIKADLIAVATHRRSNFGHVLFGSIAEEVSDKTVRPVLTSAI